jgi:hypothetical protein
MIQYALVQKNAKNKQMLIKNPVLRKVRMFLIVLVAVCAVVGTTAVVSALTATTTISSSLGVVISLLTTSGTVNVDVTPSGAGAQSIQSDTVTVSTNDPAGYTLTLQETSASTDLVSGSDTIPHSSGSQASPVAMSANTWGYAVAGVGGFNASGYTSTNSAAISGSLKFAAVPDNGSPNTIKTTSSTASSDPTSVWYAVAANTSQASGTYTNSVTYTATTN